MLEQIIILRGSICFFMSWFFVHDALICKKKKERKRNEEPLLLKNKETNWKYDCD